jgi:hypothetical protein
VGSPRHAPARPSIRRGLIGLAAALVAAPAATAAPLPARATDPIAILSSSQWTETLTPTNAVHFVGQIQNVSGNPVALVTIYVDWTDVTPPDPISGLSTTTVTHTSTIATRTVLGNNDVSPFDDTEFFPSADTVTANAAESSITYARAIATPYYLDASIDLCPAGDPADEICGTVTNDDTLHNATLLTVDSVRAILTYTSGGVTVGTDRWGVDNDLGGSVFKPGDRGHFEFFRTDGHSSVTIQPADAEPAYPVEVADSLDIGHVNVGKAGQQDLVVYNNGSLPITFQAPSGQPTQFTATTVDCTAAALPAGKSCHITVKFSPTALGLQPGMLTISDNAAGNQQTVLLTGSGSAPAVAFNPTNALDFGNKERAGAPGLQKTATLLNTGDGPLTIASFAVDDKNDFSVDGSACPTAPYALGGGAQCPISVTFHPRIAGPYGSLPHTNVPVTNLIVTDDAGTGTQKLPLTGFGAGPGAQFLSSGVDFSTQRINTTSAPAKVTIYNNGDEPLLISGVTLTSDGVQPTNDFGQTNNCTTLPPLTSGGLPALPAGQSCDFTITFTPTQLGQRPGQLTLSDNAAIGQQSISLTGMAIAGLAGPALRNWLRTIPNRCGGPRPPLTCRS